MRIRLTKSTVFGNPGQVLDMDRVPAEGLIRAKRAELVPATSGREEKMVPQRRSERMKSK